MVYVRIPALLVWPGGFIFIFVIKIAVAVTVVISVVRGAVIIRIPVIVIVAVRQAEIKEIIWCAAIEPTVSVEILSVVAGCNPAAAKSQTVRGAFAKAVFRAAVELFTGCDSQPVVCIFSASCPLVAVVVQLGRPG